MTSKIQARMLHSLLVIEIEVPFAPSRLRTYPRKWEVIQESSSVHSQPELASGKLAGHFKSRQLNRGGDCRGTDRRSREINSVGADNFLRFAGFSVYKRPVFGAKEDTCNVSEVKGSKRQKQRTVRTGCGAGMSSNRNT